MAFKTKLDFSNNRQVKQHIETFTQLSGGTKFGLPFNQLPTGPNLTTSGITYSATSLLSTFSGNSATTVYTWFNSSMNVAVNSLSALTLTSSGVTQYASGFTGTSYSSLDGNTFALGYSGATFDITPINIINLGGGNYSGSVQTDQLYFISAATLDFTGRTIWADVSGITRTQNLIITNTPSIGSVFTCIDSEGKGSWVPVSAATSGLWIPGTGVNSARLNSGLNLAGGSGAVSHGYTSHANGDYSYAGGWYTQSLGNYGSHAEGSYSIAVGDSSHAEGYTTTASGTSSHAEGIQTISNGIASHSEGNQTISNGIYSHAEGNGSKANGDSSHAEGGDTSGPYNGGTANGIGSHAEGILTIASGYASHAEGYNTLAYSSYTHAEGSQTTASGLGAHAEGSETVASGNGSHAQGNSTTAAGTNSHAEGSNSLAQGNQSHAEGNGTQAIGDNSHAGGTSCISSGATSFVHGDSSIALAANTIVLGANITGATANTTYLDRLNIKTLGVYSGNTAAISAGLEVGTVYRTSTGQLMVRY